MSKNKMWAGIWKGQCIIKKKKIQQNKQTPLTTKAKQQQKNQGGLYTVYGYCEGNVIE